MQQQELTKTGLVEYLNSLNPQQLSELDEVLYEDDADASVLEAKGWQVWLKTLFPSYASKGFAEYHVDFWEWAWAVEQDGRPQPYVSIWPRGGAKSTSAELACVAWAARRKRKYVLYICETQEQADDHVSNIAAMLESDGIATYYPDLGKPLVGKYGNSKGWRRNRCRTATGFTIDALGLDSAARGAKLDADRPDAMVPDDIDSETDSKEATDKKVKILTRKLIPAGAENLALLFAQNLVHKDSVIAQMADGRADFASDRIVAGPIPALRGFDYEREGNRVRITRGEPTWPDGMGLDRCQKMIDDMGITAFQVECQHNVHIISGEKSFREYDEIYHVITWTEFAEFFGTIAKDVNGKPRIPSRWKKERGLDWGTTPEHPSVAIFSTRPGKADPLSDCVFTFGEIVRPVWPPVDPHAKVEMVSPGRVARAIKDFQRQQMILESEIKGVMSHEASATLATFLVDLPQDEKVFFSKWKARKGSGVPQIQEVLAIDKTKPHPFRKDPKTGLPLMGRPRHYIVVENIQGALYYDTEGHLKVRQPINEKGLARLRAEIPEFDERASGAAKIFDDACDAWRGEAAGFFVSAVSESEDEKREKKLSPSIQIQNIPSLPKREQGRAIQSRIIQLDAIKQAEAKPQGIKIPRLAFRK